MKLNKTRFRSSRLSQFSRGEIERELKEALHFTNQHETECSVRFEAVLEGRVAAGARPRRLLRPPPPNIREWRARKLGVGSACLLQFAA